MRSGLLMAAQNQWLAENLPRLAFSRRAVRRFMPGETLADALAECEQLAQAQTGSVITRLGENITSQAEAEDVARHYVTALDDIERRGLPTHLSVKLTQLGLDLSVETAIEQTAIIARHERRPDVPVWIDMESSAYVDRTIEVFRALQNRQLRVGLCVQAYLPRTIADIEVLLSSTSALRLVKGAYKEPASVAIQRKRDVDANYLRCAEVLLTAVKEKVLVHAPAFATHDVGIMNAIIQRAQALGVPRENYEFQMLYGINTAQQQRLVRDGFRLRVLISYGSAWFAWYMRRLAERPANVWFVLKSIVR